MSGPALRLERQQKQVATPRLQQAVRLLQLSSLDFALEVTALMERNPFLEMDAGETERETETETDSDSDSDIDGEGEGEGALDFNSDSDIASRHAAALERPEPAQEAPGLRELLTRQAGWLRLSARDHGLLCTLIESLDDDGYLRMGLDELAQLTGLVPLPDASELRAAVHRVQAMEPAGVGARTLAECLLLQLGGPDPVSPAVAADTALARCILSEHVTRLAQRDLTGLARVLGCELEQVMRAWRRIRELDPRPGARHSSALARFVTPDVTVRKLRGVWHVELNPAIAPKLRVNLLYAELFARHCHAGHAGHAGHGSHSELAEHLKEAHWMVRNIAQRLSTIAAVAAAILRHQHHFLEFGPLAMRPLGLREIAAEVGVHESTVCRVTNNKFMATPVGTFELKYFFSRALPTRAGGACSATAVRGVIAQIVAAESAARPLSDVDIAGQLHRQGLSVARRTVTQYRQQLKLPAAGRRRVLACG